jgi:quercetin dioxygenase-like cupin family protein
MRIVRKGERGTYVPPGHDAAVTAEKLFDPTNGCSKVDVHITTFAPHTGMEEETHPFSDHVLYMLEGELEARQGGKTVSRIGKGDSLHIPAGESHQIVNPSSKPATFVAVTVPPA